MASRHRITLDRVHGIIFTLSNRLRRDRSLIYTFSSDIRTALIPVMIDPEGSYRTFVRFIKESDKLGSWEDCLKLAEEYDVSVEGLAHEMGAEVAELKGLYEKIRELGRELKNE